MFFSFLRPRIVLYLCSFLFFFFLCSLLRALGSYHWREICYFTSMYWTYVMYVSYDFGSCTHVKQSIAWINFWINVHGWCKEKNICLKRYQRLFKKGKWQKNDRRHHICIKPTAPSAPHIHGLLTVGFTLLFIHFNIFGTRKTSMNNLDKKTQDLTL